MIKPKSIVTGGAGFIGSHLVDKLISENHEVHVIDDLRGGHESNLQHLKSNSNLHFHKMNILDLCHDSKIFHNANFVFHLAGIGDIVPSIENPEEYFKVNVQGTVKVLEAARFNGVSKFVYAASSSCYGLAETPTSENCSISPMYPYAMSKYLGEQVSLHWQKVYGLPVNSICIFNAYGRRVKTTGAYGAVFGVFLKQKLSGKPLTVVGDGSQSRDFIHVKDVANAFFLAANCQLSGERFNIGAGNPKSINELVQIIGGEKIYIPKRPGEPDVTFADISKAKSILGWQPSISFDQGVKDMIDSIEEWESAPLWDPSSIEQATSSWFRFMSKDI